MNSQSESTHRYTTSTQTNYTFSTRRHTLHSYLRQTKNCPWLNADTHESYVLRHTFALKSKWNKNPESIEKHTDVMVISVETAFKRRINGTNAVSMRTQTAASEIEHNRMYDVVTQVEQTICGICVTEMMLMTLMVQNGLRKRCEMKVSITFTASLCCSCFVVKMNKIEIRNYEASDTQFSISSLHAHNDAECAFACTKAGADGYFFIWCYIDDKRVEHFLP